MGFAVKVRQFDQPLDVEMGQTILEAALARDLPYPHGCRSGNCGACKSELLTGEVEMTPFSEFALSEAEKAGGLILACRAVPWSDCEIKFLDPEETVVHPLRHMICRVVELAQATHDIRVVRLSVDSGGPYSFAAGQYASVQFADLPARDYSMANRPDEEILEFHIRLLPGGAVTPHVANELKVGDRVKVIGPYGSSHLREKHTGPVLALAGGSGLAPIKSIVETALAQGAQQKMTLYFGVRAERDLYLEDHFRGLCARHPNLDFIPVLSQANGPTQRRMGFLADAVRGDFETLDGAKAYLAGPPVMVETAMAALMAMGLRRQDCHADAFYTEADKAAIAAKSD